MPPVEVILVDLAFGGRLGATAPWFGAVVRTSWLDDAHADEVVRNAGSLDVSFNAVSQRYNCKRIGRIEKSPE
ncbi:hypothetical protein [Nocardia abscessus]|uniref:hypothetical protein n=1 Tax=Nocardia abscessus TaxID=120957 RepID=UPI002456ED3A|nr:hypothetical protein [Nocardia abscessus]